MKGNPMSAQIGTTNLKFSFAALLKSVLTDTLEVPASIGEDINLAFTNGTAENQADRGWQSESRALVSGASETLDLYDLGSIDIGNGAGRDPLGLQQANVELVGLLIQNVGSVGNLGTLVIGGEGSAAAWASFIKSDTVVLDLPPRGVLFLACPYDPAWPIADVSSHLLKFAASGGNVAYKIWMLTRSA